MRLAILLLVLGLASCSRSGDQTTARERPETKSAGSEPNFDKVAVADLRTAAEAGSAPAQRELAARMLFGEGMTANPAGALVWVERAAKGGDETAALWMGRKLLNDPPERIAAAAWFLIAAEGTNSAIRQDAASELEALVPSAEELVQAEQLSSKWEVGMSKGPK